MILKTTLLLLVGTWFFTKSFFLFMKQHHPHTLLSYQIWSLTQTVKILHFVPHYPTHNELHKLHPVSPLPNPCPLSLFLNLMCLIHPLIFLHNHFDILHISNILLHGIKITCYHLAPIIPLLAKVLLQVHDTHFLILFLIPTYLLLTALFQLTFLNTKSLHHVIKSLFLPTKRKS